MAKLVLNDIQSGYQTADQYNENNRLIEEALENTVSRDGTTPNTLLADIDANSNSINNIQTTRTQVLYINGQQATVGAIGEKGEQGDPGVDGIDGIDGITGVDTIVDLTDTTISAPTEGQLMAWDGTSKWINADPVVPSNSVVQVVSMQDGEVATGTTMTPNDDTIPQITEGTEFMTLAITPKHAANVLKIEFAGIFAHTGGASWISMHLHQDATANALAAQMDYLHTANLLSPISGSYKAPAGTTNEITFRIRCGSSTAGTLTFNGTSGFRQCGGVMASNIIITEYMA